MRKYYKSHIDEYRLIKNNFKDLIINENRIDGLHEAEKSNYETVILLHNEYVTKKEFDAISTHPNLIFIHPNALYAEINVNYDDNTMTLIRGHNYPEKSIANGFGYEIEERFHDYEYDLDCLEWEFIKIENGYHLNCYPDAIITENLEILIKLKELLSSP